jgi:hypothetical protein
MKSSEISFAITVVSVFGYLSINRICNMFEKVMKIKYEDYYLNYEDEKDTDSESDSELSSEDEEEN